MAKRKRRGRKHQKGYGTNPVLSAGEDTDMLVRYTGKCECGSTMAITTWNGGETVSQPCRNCKAIVELKTEIKEVV